jgi:TPP-dependent pyruvate/acetoin dehydrogenase alpha subunit
VAGTAVGRAAAFGIPAESVDGMDVDAVVVASSAAVARARADRGPTLLEFLTYRFDCHHTVERVLRVDYRTAAEIEAWRRRDPLEIQGVRIDAAERARIDARVEETIADAVEFARSSPRPHPADALDHLYASGLRPRAGIS